METKTSWVQRIGDSGEFMILANYKEGKVTVIAGMRTDNGYSQVALWLTSMEQVEQLMLNLNSALGVAYAEEF